MFTLNQNQHVIIELIRGLEPVREQLIVADIYIKSESTCYYRIDSWIGTRNRTTICS